MRSDLPSVMAKSVKAADWNFCQACVGSLSDDLTFEVPVPIGIARGHIVQVTGTWSKRTLLREMTGLRGVFGRSAPITWAGLAPDVEMDRFIDESESVPYFGSPCPSFHPADLFWKQHGGAEERALESMQGVSAVEMKKWTDLGRAVAQELPHDRNLLRGTSVLLSNTKFNEQFARLYEGQGIVVRPETVDLLSGIVSDAVTCASGRIFWGQGEEFQSVEMRAAGMAGNLLVANAVARSAMIQRVPQRSINSLGKAPRRGDETLGELFGEASTHSLYQFDEGIGGAMVLPPGSVAEFPFIGLPIPRVRADRGIVVVYRISPAAAGQKFDDLSMNVGYWDQNVTDFIAATGAGITKELNNACLSLLQVAISAAKTRANQDRADDHE